MTGVLLEVVDDLGLFIQLPDVYHPLGELSTSSVNHLVPHHHLPSLVDGLLLGETQTHLSHKVGNKMGKNNKKKKLLVKP